MVRSRLNTSTTSQLVEFRCTLVNLCWTLFKGECYSVEDEDYYEDEIKLKVFSRILKIYAPWKTSLYLFFHKNVFEKRKYCYVY